MANFRNILEKLTTNRRSVIASAVVVFAVLLALFGWRHFVYAPTPVDIPTEVEQNLTEVSGQVMEESFPVRIRIPEIGVDTTFEEPIGLQTSGEIETPSGYEEVAYYKYGPTPGELGPSVILGHVDSYQGPAVFFSLGQLEEGDEIEIEREDGTVAVFAVTDLQKHSQEGFPTREVYQDIDHAGLRLITCTGVYNHGTLRYSHNLIVFAKLVEVR